MKKLVLLLAAGLVAGLITTGCDSWTRTPPTLISPEEGEVFQTEAPSFSWEEQGRIDSFRIEISTDSSLGALKIIDEELTATSYALNSTIFEGLPRGKYFWKVANIMGGVELWSEERTFQIDHDLPELNLDTTYYPLALGYKWVYQNWIDDEVEDTNSVEVTEVTNNSELTTYTITIVPSHGMSFDLPSPTILFGNLLYPGLDSVSGSEDTLHVYSSSSGVSETPWESSNTTDRVKGLGLLYQYIRYSDWNVEQTFEDRLLYFIKSEDTVWTAD